ncbi:MAG TPA: hypothetical protein VI958_10305 [Acidobacteriota bacterium]
MSYKKIAILAGIFFVANLAFAKIKFSDVEKQTKEFIGYYQTIQLTADQEKSKKEALSGIPAPCCSDFSIATCCCPCNLAKSVWGLSNFLITRQNYTAAQLKGAVQEWLQFTNKSGYSGNSCNMGHCGQPFKHDGCGGMKENQIAF